MNASPMEILAGISLAFVLMLVVAAALLCTSLLQRPRFAPIRKTLAQSQHRWLGCAIPFGPAIMNLALRLGPNFSANGLPAVLLVLGVVFSSVGSAAFAACWLCLPRDPSQRIHRGYAVLLSIGLWLLDLTVIWIIAHTKFRRLDA